MNDPSAFPEKITYGDKYGPAMDITDEHEAQAYFEKCVRHCMQFFEKTREEAEQIERFNLGYYSGYYSKEVAARVEALFRARHPIFGKVKNWPGPYEAFELGKDIATRRTNDE